MDPSPESDVVATRPRFAPIPEEILLDPDLSGDAVRLWGLLDRTAQRDRVWPGRERLATQLRCSVATVDRRIAELVKAGWIEVRRRGQGRTNLYTIHDRRVPRVVKSEDSRVGSREDPESSNLRTQESSPVTTYRDLGEREEEERESLSSSARLTRVGPADHEEDEEGDGGIPRGDVHVTPDGITPMPDVVRAAMDLVADRRTEQRRHTLAYPHRWRATVRRRMPFESGDQFMAAHQQHPEWDAWLLSAAVDWPPLHERVAYLQAHPDAPDDIDAWLTGPCPTYFALEAT